MQLITHSRQHSFKTCRKAHQFAYNYGIRRELDGKALRMGSAFHAGIESLGLTHGIDAAVESVRRYYSELPVTEVDDERGYECETVVRLVCGYNWRWNGSQIEYVATERSFAVPLINPETGRASMLYRLAGKIDGIVRLGDGRLAVIEHKTTSDDIGPDSDTWRRMRIDGQVSLYVVAARRLGYAVDTVLYDVCRKPTIRPSKVPILDELGAKIVLNNAGNRVKTKTGQWRQTGDKDMEYVLQERAMTPDEWGDKLNADIGERPDYYFQRVEVPRMDQDLRDFEAELWDVAKAMRDAELSDRNYRTVGANTCGFCSYFDLCTNRGFDPAGVLPPGFKRVEDLHPELGGFLDDDNSNSPAPEASPSTASEVAAAGIA